MVLLDHPETDDAAADDQVRRLQRELDDARASSWPRSAGPSTRIASFIGSQRRRRWRSSARRGAWRRPTARCCCWARPAPARSCWRTRIHAASARAARPFVGVNIAAVPETLLEAEFFGVAPGAYTGAERKGRDGKFKLADGGTLLPRRDRRHAAGAAGQAAARAAGAGGRAAGQQPRAAHRRARHRRDQPRPAGDGGRGHASAPTCTTGSTCCRSACRRCASGSTTWRRWSRRWPRTSRGAAACRTRA